MSEGDTKRSGRAETDGPGLLRTDGPGRAEAEQAGHVRVERRGRVMVIRLARAEKKNALTVAMYEAITEALSNAEADEEIRVILLAGSPGVFTAGNDIADFLERPPTGESSAVFRLLRAVTELEKPIVAAVDGPAVGIGTTLLLHCDTVVASSRARFQLPFVNLGLVCEGASSLLLPMLVGFQRASEWLLLGEPFDAEAARAAGLVNAVVAPEELEAKALERAEAFASRPPEALRLTKRLLRDPVREKVAAALKREGEIFVERLRSDEAKKAFSAFLGKKQG